MIIASTTNPSVHVVKKLFTYSHVILRIVIFLDFHSNKQGLPLVDSWSRGLD